MTIDSSTGTVAPARTPGRVYWRSLEQLANSPEYRQQVLRDLPALARELIELGEQAVDRRRFLQIMGASMALAGIATTGCRRPEIEVLPYTRKPEEVVPGLPNYYATAMPRAGTAYPVLVESHEGRPTKIEGNPNHRDTQGGTDVFAQASVLDLYDPDRSRNVLTTGNTVSSWAAFDAFATDHFEAIRQAKGKGLRILSEDLASPAIDLVREHIGQAMPEAQWHVYEPIGTETIAQGTDLAYGQALTPRYDLSEAKIVLTLDCDLLDTEDDLSRNVRAFSKARTVDPDSEVDPADQMNRLYTVEHHYSLTGGMADHRYRLPASRIAEYTLALAKTLFGAMGDEVPEPLRPIAESLTSREPIGAFQTNWLEAVADDLRDHAGQCLVAVGRKQPPLVHAVAHAMNTLLGNVGTTVTYKPTVDRQVLGLAELIEAIDNGQVETLVILAGNPVFNAPADLPLGDRLSRGFVSHVIRLGLHVDETSRLGKDQSSVEWHLPAAHYLESWADAETVDGTRLAIQPLIDPLYEGRSALELLAQLSGYDLASGYEIVRRSFQNYAGLEGAELEAAWRTFLHNGVSTVKLVDDVAAELQGDAVAQAVEQHEGPANELGKDNLEVVFLPDKSIHDGRFANNGWLQEAPDPVTKLTWDNAALVSPRTANELGIKSEEMIRITLDGRTLRIVALVVPGHADWSISLPLGYGRRDLGRVAEGTGFDVYPLRSSDASEIALGAEVTRLAGATYPLSLTQDHYDMGIGVAFPDAEAMGEERFQEIYQIQDVSSLGSHSDGHGTNHSTDDHHDAESESESHSAGEGDDHGSEGAHGHGEGGHGGHGGPLPDIYRREPFLDSEEHRDSFREDITYQQWGLTIDLNTCIGCNACVVACQSENNIPIVGKDEIKRGRSMHWIRNDRYFSGDPNDPDSMVHQPVACQQCENAPCEQVCPVNAAVHSEEGLNLQVYNRCVGTRYCANNCPYKVRRFNWFNYNERPLNQLRLGPLAEKGVDEPLKMQKNPDVTVRVRGVMEKCTYCVQRIQQAKIGIKTRAGQDPEASHKVPDGVITPACAQACPAESIVFGDVSDPNSRVSRLKAQDRNYDLLGEVNAKPRTSYLARLRNPNPRMTRLSPEATTTSEAGSPA